MNRSASLKKKKGSKIYFRNVKGVSYKKESKYYDNQIRKFKRKLLIP